MLIIICFPNETWCLLAKVNPLKGVAVPAGRCIGCVVTVRAAAGRVAAEEDGGVHEAGGWVVPCVTLRGCFAI